MGRMVSTLSLTRLQKYSLFQKYKARSATFKKKQRDQQVDNRLSFLWDEPGSEGWQRTWPADGIGVPVLWQTRQDP